MLKLSPVAFFYVRSENLNLGSYLGRVFVPTVMTGFYLLLSTLINEFPKPNSVSVKGFMDLLQITYPST